MKEIIQCMSGFNDFNFLVSKDLEGLLYKLIRISVIVKIIQMAMKLFTLTDKMLYLVSEPVLHRRWKKE